MTMSCYWRKIFVKLIAITAVMIVIFAMYKYGLQNVGRLYNEEYCIERNARLGKVFLPDVDLLLRMYNRHVNRYRAILQKSTRYFWPGNMSLVIVLDSESNDDLKLGRSLSTQFPYLKICFQGPGDSSVYHENGHKRMQLDYFYPEKYTSKQYVGYLDTDTLFVTRVTEELLFEDEKPVIIGFYGKIFEPAWSKIAEVTAVLFKSKEVMRGMAYFPVIMKVEHIIELRRYLEQLHGKSFINVYKEHSKLYISQFNIMCQYVWMFHRNEYRFYFQLRPFTLDGIWNGEKNSPGRQSPEFYRTQVRAEEKMPKPRAAIHYRYHNGWKSQETIRDVIKTGLCFSGGFDLCPNMCRHLNNSGLQEELFQFDYSDWTWDKRCMAAQKKHYEFVARQRDTESDKAIRLGCSEVDTIEYDPSA
ncbi:hypothetical protein ACJMK2_025507 [Sinanodonta woodiana]|uniref:Uncharacterized protein n=1 Tax=Sinanodonta woodiana TaxID=1069815 RepID=A0ABD3XI89_SINWO